MDTLPNQFQTPTVISSMTPPPPLPKGSSLPHRLLRVLLILIIISGIGIAGVYGVTKFFPNLSNLTLLPIDAEFYLSVAVKEHPQANAMQKLTDRFPGSSKIKERPGFFSRELLGTPKDPFEDILKLADSEIFLAKLPDDKTDEPEDDAPFSQPLEKLLNLVELKDAKSVAEQLNIFKTNTGEYRTSAKDVEDTEVLDINLVSKGRESENIDIGGLPLNLTLPLSEQIYATGLGNFIASSEKESDIKKMITLFKNSSILDKLQGGGKEKSILDDPGHKAISKFFPEQSFLKFYQHQPLEAFSNLIPSAAVSQSFLLGFDDLQKVEGENNIEVSRGLSITAEENGVRLNSLQLDWRTPEENLKNPYKVTDSLATRLPAKFSGLLPFLFAETKNLKQLYQDQQKILQDAAAQTKNPKQKEHFDKAVADMNKSKEEFKRNFGVDLEEDILSWMDSNAAFIFNAGSKGKAPEFLFVADIKDKNTVEQSFSKFRIPNYKAEREKQFGNIEDTTRIANLRQIASGLEVYYTKNLKWPRSLTDLQGETLRTIPKDPVTSQSYKYSLTPDGKSAQIEATLDDSRTAFYNTDKGFIEYRGTTKPKDIDSSPIKPVKIPYKDTNIYSFVLIDGNEFGTTASLKYYLYLASTGSKAVMLFSDTAKSLQEIVDFESKPVATLSSMNTWKEQFENFSPEVGGLVYIEPIRIYGLWEFYQDLFSDTAQDLNFTFTQSDTQTVAKSYLATLSSIGTTVSKEKPVYNTSTFISIKEIKKEEKDKAVAALERLLDESENRNRQFQEVRERVQGADETNWSEYFLDLRTKVMPIGH